MAQTSHSPDEQRTGTAGLIAAGGLLGAIGASTCCVVPLVLFSAGVSGAWIGTLTALEPYQPVFIAAAVALLGYGYWFVYRKRAACAADAACARPLPGLLVRSALWIATALVIVALSWKWTAPFVAPLLLGQ